MRHKTRVVVTGMGAVSAYGIGVSKFLTATLAGRSAVRPISYFNSNAYRSNLGAPLADGIFDNPPLHEWLEEPREEAALLALLAAEEAFRDAGLVCGTETRSEDIGCVVATLCAGARSLESLGLYATGRQADVLALVDAELVHATQVRYQLDCLSRAFGLHGPQSLVSTACASGTDAIGLGLEMIRSGECQQVLVAGGDIIGEVIHAAFNAVFSISTDRPRPFDISRNGFVIGEGGAALVLESEESALRRGTPIYAELCGYGLSNSAYHLTAPSKDGSSEAMCIGRALEDAGITPDQIDFVNAHGTGTPHNDAAEVKALRQVLGKHSPHVSLTSIKSMIGHCMGVAGLLEAVSTVHSVRTGEIPPTLHCVQTEPDNDLQLCRQSGEKRLVRFALSNSFGFAGHNASVVFANY